MWWLGYDPITVKAREIGARAHFFKRNHHTSENFVHQMAQTFALLSKAMVPASYACFIVGGSKIHGKIVNNAQTIIDVSRKYGFRQVFETERVLSPSRKSFNLSHANIKREALLVLRLDGDRCA
jgi:site-specific DNA-methyltransferase (cytosine-N4-specific)